MYILKGNLLSPFMYVRNWPLVLDSHLVCTSLEKTLSSTVSIPLLSVVLEASWTFPIHCVVVALAVHPSSCLGSRVNEALCVWLLAFLGVTVDSNLLTPLTLRIFLLSFLQCFLSLRCRVFLSLYPLRVSSTK